MDPRKDRPKRNASLNESQPTWLRRFLKDEEELNHLVGPVTKWQAPSRNNKRNKKRSK